MLEAYDEFRGKVLHFVEYLGLDIVYVTTTITLVLCVFALKRARHWDTLSHADQFLIRSIFLVTAIMVVISILHIAGVV